ncbi:MAG TPA: histidinol dehydrogenase, partial [Trueperaceae bacterium]|nr:histidinol dehydrogenase [Trueperaceae bacterium]
PAQVAGVENIVLITPPNSEGKIAPEIIRTAEILGINAIYRIGGAVGIAALAYGTQTIPRVDKIVGPGNKYTMAAKKLVYGDVGIESLPGPTETLIIADDWADYQHVVADLLAQAEHEGAQPVLVTTSKSLIDDVKEVIHYQLSHLESADSSTANNAESAKKSLKNGYIVLVHDLEEAIDLANIYAPEHLCLLCKEPWELLPEVKNAGGIFLGDHSLEAIGDYIAGPSHVMPTSGTARFSSSINVRDFQKIIPLVNLNKEVFDELAPAAIRMARREGLEAHARAIESRLSDD